MSPNAWRNLRTIVICLVVFGGSFAWWAHIAGQKEEVRFKAAEAKAQEEADKRYSVKGRYVDMGDGPREPFKSPPQAAAPTVTSSEATLPKPEDERRPMRIRRAVE